MYRAILRYTALYYIWQVKELVSQAEAAALHSLEAVVNSQLPELGLADKAEEGMQAH